MKVIGVDPGPVRSALVVLDGDKVTHTWQLTNEVLMRSFGDLPYGIMAIEKIESMGMAVGAEVFETVFWTGRFFECWQAQGGSVVRVTRRQVKLHLCGSMRAKDANVRQALIDKFGGSKQAAIGKKKTPGPLYGVSSHCWSALAVGVTWLETQANVPA